MAQLRGSFSLGFASDLYEGWIRVKKICPKPFALMEEIFDFPCIFFQIFSCDFDSNHGQSFQFWYARNLEYPMSDYTA